MSRALPKDNKERYLTYAINLRQANKEKAIQEEVVTKTMAKFIDGDKFLNATILLEGDLRETSEDAAFFDDDVRMDEKCTCALHRGLACGL
ncbi:hypothetical protein GN244_ATG05380 [Phytophthora infestans]|uniref:Uncharacterized protein n=1 Tax=Phytophthora infestans TaxID=4787 RepID=A0A833SXB8_PHYIN|nr:hypothetical protein GN244_ATG05380 [Phytophthora infestans]